MLSLKKNIQKIFKSLGYFVFRIIYGEIKGVLNPTENSEIELQIVKKTDKFSYSLYKIKNARLYTDRIKDTAIIKNNKIIEGPSFQFRTMQSEEVVNRDIKENIVFKNGTPRIKKNIKGNVVSLLTGGGGNDNYWHWMFDVLPRISICEDKINLSDINFFLVPDNKKRFQRESLEILQIPKEKQISSKKFRHISSSNLYVTSHPVVLSNNATKDIHNIPEWISLWLRKKFLENNINSRKNLPKKIYLDRSDSKSKNKNLRSIINEDEVKNYLISKGFSAIKLTDLSFVDQALTFYNADIIVGLHGAGFANIIFCKPNTKILELKANPFDKVIKSLANNNKLSHDSISLKGEEIKNYNQYGHIKISIDQLDKRIKI